MKALLIAGSAVLLVAAIAMYLWLRDDNGAAASPSSPTADPIARRDPAPAPSLPSGAGTEAPTLGSATAAGSDDVKVYNMGGVIVRDHRGPNSAPPDLPPNIHAPDARKVDSKVVHALSQRVKTVIAECATAVPVEARGDKPRVEGTITIAIKDHVAKIATAAVKLRQVVGAALDPAQTCIEQKSIGLDAPADGEADLETYSIGITYALP